MGKLIKIIKDTANYEYAVSIDGNKYGDAFDITTMDGFGDLNLVDEGWEEVLAVNGSLFYYDKGSKNYFANGLEKSRGVNNQELEMSAVTDYNNSMAIGVTKDGRIDFDKQCVIMSKLGSYYGAITGMGIMKDGAEVDWGHNEFASQWNTISGRTIIGTDVNGNYMSYSLAGVTGSSGLYGSQLYSICKSEGFHNAILLDGGGSVFRRYFGDIDIKTSRKVKNALLIYRRAKASPEGKVQFFPRLAKEGMANNKYWYNKDYNVGADGALQLPNCTTYACGRFGELNNQNMRNMMKKRTGFGNACEWYNDTKYDKGSEPKVGSIACFGGKYGHVAIVERVNEDGTITVSQSNYEECKAYHSDNYFQTRTYTLEVGKVAKGVGLVFQGYIYPPNLKEPVERDTTKFQVKVLADRLKVRDAANGNWIEGRYAQKGEIYNVNKVEESGWLQIGDNAWIMRNDEEGWTETYSPVKPEPGDDKDKKIKELEAKVAYLEAELDKERIESSGLIIERDKAIKERDKLAKDYDELLQKNINYGERLTEIHCISDTSRNFNI